MQQLALFTELQVLTFDTDQGLIEYRCLPREDILPVSSPNHWDYRPVGRECWREVKLRQIRENLDAGLHPRTGVFLAAPDR
jgi:hypothetical protein